MQTQKSDKWHEAMTRKRGTTARNQYTKAKELGLPPPSCSEETREKISGAGRGRRHSPETKEKIRRARLDFLEKNPHMVPYKLNHSSKGRSYPEGYWKGILDAEGIPYTEKFHIGLYELDFAILSQDSKIDLEIDGDQHHLDPKIAESDIRRNKYLEELGWTIIRVKWSDYQSLTDKESFVKTLIAKIKSPTTVFLPPPKSNIFSHKCIACDNNFETDKRWAKCCSDACRAKLRENKRKVARPSYEELMQSLEEMSMVKVGEKYGVSDNCIRKWIELYEKDRP